MTRSVCCSTTTSSARPPRASGVRYPVSASARRRASPPLYRPTLSASGRAASSPNIAARESKKALLAQGLRLVFRLIPSVYACDLQIIVERVPDRRLARIGECERGAVGGVE